MIANLSAVFIAASIMLVSTAAFAQTGKAPCGAFQKLPNGKWNVVRPVKIENGKTSVTVNPGTSIGPGTRLTGVDVYAALEKSCLQAGNNNPPGGRPQ